MSANDFDVVVTGIGATTPIGGTAPETWQALLAGTVGVTANTAPWVEKYGLPVAIHAPLAVEPTEVIPRVEARRLDRCQQVAVIAAQGGVGGRRRAGRSSRSGWARSSAPESVAR